MRTDAAPAGRPSRGLALLLREVSSRIGERRLRPGVPVKNHQVGGAGDATSAKRVAVHRRSSSGSDRRRKPMPTLSTEQSGARKIRARIQTCLESRAGSGTHGTLGRPPSRSRQAPRATATEVTASTATSAETTSRDDESSNVMVDPERWDAAQAGKAEVRHRSPTRSTSAGLSQRAFTGSSAATTEPWQQVRTSPPPLAFAPPKKAVQTLGASAPAATTAEAAASAAAATTTAGGDSQELLQVYRNIFEEVILRDHEYGATLRKVKGVYESYFLEVQRENARLRDFVATLQRALQGRGAAQAPLRWTAPSPDRDLAAAWAPAERIQVATASPQRPFARPASVPRLDLQSLSPTRAA